MRKHGRIIAQWVTDQTCLVSDSVNPYQLQECCSAPDPWPSRGPERLSRKGGVPSKASHRTDVVALNPALANMEGDRSHLDKNPCEAFIQSTLQGTDSLACSLYIYNNVNFKVRRMWNNRFFSALYFTQSSLKVHDIAFSHLGICLLSCSSSESAAFLLRYSNKLFP